MSYERANIAALSGYVPGEQPDMSPVEGGGGGDRGEASGRGIVKLNTNENPYPQSDRVLDAIRSISPEALRRYPQPQAQGFREVAAQAHGLSPDQVIATNGGDELLRLAITVFCEPAVVCGDHGETTGAGSGGSEGGLGIADPSYSLYPILAAIHGTPITRVPLGDRFDLPDNMADQLNAAGCRLAMIVNPHAPSGRLESIETLRALARGFHGVLLVDEAYVDFAERDALPLLSPGLGLKNVLLLRTLSKGYSLAGLRFGYGLGHAGLIAALDKARDSYNTDVVGQVAAEAALDARHDARETWRAVVSERDRLSKALSERGFTVYPSGANFVLVVAPTASAPTDAPSLYQRLADRGIYVRYFDQQRLRDKLRITVGDPQQNDVLLAALDRILAAQDAKDRG